jgi:hypothetical protein
MWWLFLSLLGSGGGGGVDVDIDVADPSLALPRSHDPSDVPLQ